VCQKNMSFKPKLTKFEKEMLGECYDLNDRDTWMTLEKAVIDRNLFWIQYYCCQLQKNRVDRLIDRLGEPEIIIR